MPGSGQPVLESPPTPIDEDVLREDPDWRLPPLQLPLTGAWFCQTFSPYLMPLLYGAARAVLGPAARERNPEILQELEPLLQVYSTSLFPVLTLALEARLFRQACPPGLERSLNIGMDQVPWKVPESCRVSLPASQAPCLPLPSASVEIYRLNNTIHQAPDRRPLLEEAARVLCPGGLLQVVDNSRAWVEAIWTVRLARALRRGALAERLIQDKLKSSGQNLVPEVRWWTRGLDPRQWELVSVQPFFSTTAMTVASIFESLNFKQGGTSPEWISRRVRKSFWLRPLYHTLLSSLGQALIESDAARTAARGGTSLLVTARRRG